MPSFQKLNEFNDRIVAQIDKAWRADTRRDKSQSGAVLLLVSRPAKKNPLNSLLNASIHAIVSDRSKTDIYHRITELWEKRRMTELAKANANMGKAQGELDEVRGKHQSNVDNVREHVQNERVSGAELAMLSDALVTGSKSVSDATETVTNLEEPLNEAREALLKSSRKRKVAERQAERRRRERRLHQHRRMERLMNELNQLRLAVAE
jgi:flagellar export protein FliJ